MDITLVNYYIYGNGNIVAFEYLNNFNESNKLVNSSFIIDEKIN